MPVKDGVDSVLDRLFKNATMERLGIANEPEQVEKRAEGLPEITPIKRPPIMAQLQPQPQAIPPPPEPPPPPAPELKPLGKEDKIKLDDYVNKYFEEHNWPRKINRALASVEELKDFDVKLKEASDTYLKEYGTEAFIRSGIGKVGQLLFHAARIIAPGEEKLGTSDYLWSAVDLAAWTPIGWIGKGLKGAKFIKGAEKVAKVTKEIKPEVKGIEKIVEYPKKEIEASVDRFLKAIEDAPKVRKAVERMKSTALREKIPAYEEALEKATTFAQAKAARKALKGANIPEGTDIYPLAQHLENDVANLIQKVNSSEVFFEKPLTRGRIIDSLENLIVNGKLPTEAELRDLTLVFGPKFADVIGKNASWLAKLGKVAVEVINIPKSIVASGDLGVTLRQTIFLAPRHPLIAIKNTWGGFRSFWSQKYYEALEDGVFNSRFAPMREEAGLELTEITGKLKFREEAYISRWLQQIGLNWGKYGLKKKAISAPLWPISKWVQASERAFVAIANKMRADVFDKYAALWEGKATMEELKGMAEVINIFSGRGAIPRPIKGILPYLNVPFFSPRLNIARVQALGMPAVLWKYPPVVRKYVIGCIVSFVGVIGGILGMVKLSGLGEVEMNPLSTDSYKMKFGDTRVDITGGHQGYMRLIARLITGKTKTASGHIVDIDREDELLRFIRLKESTVPALIHDIFKGETFLGEELTTKPEDVKRETEERLMFFFLRDIIDAIRQDGLTGGLVASAGYLGAGITSYPSKGYADWLAHTGKELGKEWTTEEMMAVRPDYNKAEASWFDYLETEGRRARQYYREANPEIEASMYFWGELKTLSTKEAYTEFQKLLEKYNVPEGIFPIETGDKVKPEEMKEEELFPAYLDLAPKYYSDYLKENEIDVSPEMLTEFTEAKRKDKVLIDKYNNETRGFTDKERLKYKRQNPDIDIALNIWGRVSSVQTSKALVGLRLRADELGIPQELVPAISKPIQTEKPLELKPIQPGKKPTSGLKLVPIK